MKRRRDVSILVDSALPDEPIVAVQDHYGKTYRCAARGLDPGDVVAVSIRHHDRKRATGDKDCSEARYRILAPAHANTVRALARHSDYPNKPLRPGSAWYEVICD